MTLVVPLTKLLIVMPEAEAICTVPPTTPFRLTAELSATNALPVEFVGRIDGQVGGIDRNSAPAAPMSPPAALRLTVVAVTVVLSLLGDIATTQGV